MTSTLFPAPAVLETAAPIRRRIEAAGTELQIYEWGDRSRPAILLAHGIQDFALTLAPVAEASSPSRARALWPLAGWSGSGIPRW